MKIHYAPYYQGHIFRGLPQQNNILLDELVLNDQGLISHMQLLLGLHPKSLSPTNRLIQYHQALKSFLATNSNNELNNSFQISPIEVTRQCLQWRDELQLCGWSAKSPAPTQRLQALQAIENQINIPSQAQEINEIISALNKQSNTFCNDITLSLPFTPNLLHPALLRLVQSMQRHGATIEKNEPTPNIFVLPNAQNSVSDNLPKSILKQLTNHLTSNSKQKIHLAPDDQTFQILIFPDDRQAAQFMAAKSPALSQSLWINANNKSTDNWLKQMHKPTLGSSISSLSSPAAHLLLSGLALLFRPININSLLDWLQADFSPLDAKFRHDLSNKIIETGGFNNKSCKDTIDAFLNESADKKQSRQSLLNLYLPIYNVETKEGEAETDKVRNFIVSLSSWAKSKAPLSDAPSQFFALSEMSEYLLLLLQDINSQSITQKQLSNLSTSLFRAEESLQYRPECGAPFTISSPGSMVASSDETIWWNVDGDDSTDQCCAFLMPSEREALENDKDIHFWKSEDKNALHQQALLTPFFFTNNKLTLAYCETRGGEPTLKHPLLVQIENCVENWQDFVRRPTLHNEQWEPVEQTVNAKGEDVISFNNKNKVTLPNHLSATAIDTLIQHPLDYVMDRILHIQDSGASALPALSTTKGTVAHAVIERLFAPRSESEKPSANIIRTRINSEYDSALKEMTEAHGAILSLPENSLEAKLLDEQLKASLDKLLEIIATNNLVVTACERNIEGHLALLPTNNTNDAVGFIDMSLEDENHNPVIFDFKWTSSKNYYKDLLKKNVSIQLELYRHLLSAQYKCNVSNCRVAYFLMPEARLYSTDQFQEPNYEKIEPEYKDNLLKNNDDLLKKVRLSVKYRLDQIKNGKVENSDGKQFIDIPYFTDDTNDQFVPLKTGNKKDVHEENRFSKYNLFKR